MTPLAVNRRRRPALRSAMDLCRLPALHAEPGPHEAQRLRSLIRQGQLSGSSRGMALGFLQCNLAILPAEHAQDFWDYCQRNARACPVLEVTEPGQTEPARLAPGADLRSDCARYAVWRDGLRLEDRADICALWRSDLVSFLIGSGITFDEVFEQAGIPTGQHRWVLATHTPTEAVGRFHGPLIVTMRWLTPAQAELASRISARFPLNHGAPLHIGDPATIGADLSKPLFGGPVPPLPAGLVPVFWACGVTPQAAAEAAGLSLFIAHAPAHSFITDVRAASMMIP
ncbi:MAG: DUF1445 domain-containing protein [Burkholderiales bacterium]|nr:DUF1445 domain-containing protein [Burkholderiales bacterium]